MHFARSAVMMLGLAGALAPDSWAQAGEARSIASLQQRSADLARAYLHTWSSNPRAAISQVPHLYAPRTRFYGHLVGHRRLIREKSAFIQRWPVRRYAHRPGTMRVSCDGRSARCFVRSVIDWEAASPARRAVSRGSARFEQGIDLSGSRPIVFLEGGSVLASPPMRPRGAADTPRDAMSRPTRAAQSLTKVGAAVPAPANAGPVRPPPPLAAQATPGEQPLDEAGRSKRHDRPGAVGTTATRVASVEAQEVPPKSNLPEAKSEGLVLYLVTRAEITSLADLNGKAIALGPQEPEVERAITQAFAAARIAPVFVSDSGTDAMELLAAHKVVAASFLVARVTTEVAELVAEAKARLSPSGFRILEIPSDVEASR